MASSLKQQLKELLISWNLPENKFKPPKRVNVDSTIREIRSLITQIRKKENVNSEYHNKCKTLSNLIPKSRNELLLDEFLQVSRTHEVLVIDNSINVVVPNVVLEDVPLGSFYIQFQRAVFSHFFKPCLVVFANGLDAYPHPHINASGSPCLGTSYNTFRRLLQNNSIVDIVDLFDRFLHTYNPGREFGGKTLSFYRKLYKERVSMCASLMTT